MGKKITNAGHTARTVKHEDRWAVCSKCGCTIDRREGPACSECGAR